MKAKPVSLSLYFGIPGAGKSTYAAYLAKKDMLPPSPLLNVPFQNSRRVHSRLLLWIMVLSFKIATEWSMICGEISV